AVRAPAIVSCSCFPESSTMAENRGMKLRKSTAQVVDENTLIDESELDEPLSLAEELADEAERGIGLDETQERYEQIKQGDIHIAELQRMSMPQLIEQARNENLTDITGIKKQDLIFKILKER